MEGESSTKSPYPRQDHQVTQMKLKNLTDITVKLLHQLTLTQSSMNTSSNKKISVEAKLRTLSDINANLGEISKISPQAVQIFAQEQIIIYVRRILGDTTMPKIQALEYFRIILVSEKMAFKLIKYCLPIYLARVIEREESNKKIISANSFEDEAFQALRVINHWIDKFPHTFPQYLAGVLISFAELPIVAPDERDRRKDQISKILKNYTIDIFLNLSIKNTKLCCRCGGFSFLINQITNSQQKSQQIMNKMLLFLNDKQKREITHSYLDISKIFHVLTDLDNVFLEENLKAKNMHDALNRFQSKVYLAKNAIVNLMKTWVGLIFLGNNPEILSSLLEAVKQIPKKSESVIRDSIFICLQEILSIGDSIIATKPIKNQFRISNLVGCFLMSVIELFIEENILRILIEFSGVQDDAIAEPAQKLLKRITLLIFNFRPESSQYIDILITAASKKSTDNHASQLLKSSSLFVISKISSYIYDKKSKQNHPMFNQLQNLFSLKTIFIPYERASVNSIARTLNFITYKQRANYRKQLFEMQPIPKQYKEEYRFWKWKIIQDLLSFPDPEKYKSSSSDRFRQNKLYKYLMKFFSPSRGAFSKLQWEKENFKYHKVGLLLVKNTITIPQNLPLVKNPPQSQFYITISFIGDLEKLLELCILECLQQPKNMKIFKTMQRQLLGYIGLFSEQKIGCESLLYENNFFELLYGCLHKEECAHLVYIILMSLDFYKDDVMKNVKSSSYLKSSSDNGSFGPSSSGSQEEIEESIIIGPRALLKKCLREGSKPLKLASVEVLKILLMSQLPQFLIFCYRLILILLNDFSYETEIVQNMIEALQKNLKSNKNIEIFLKVINQSLENHSRLNPHDLKKSKSQNYPISMRLKSKDKSQKQRERSEEQFHLKKSLIEEEKPKINFGKIKNKFSAEIMIRLLSHENGFELIEREYPDWLENQFCLWCPFASECANNNNSKKKKEQYCLKVEKKLALSLNFKTGKTKDKQAYKIASTASNQSSDGIIYDLLFMYKLPWIVSINNQEYPLWIKQSENQYTLYREFQQPNKTVSIRHKLEQRVSGFSQHHMDDEEQTNFETPFVLASEDCVKIMLAIGTIYVDEKFNEIENDRTSINQNRKGVLNIFLSINAKSAYLYGEKLWCVQSNGVQIYYSKVYRQNLSIFFIRRINIKIKLSSTQNSEELPLHLIQSLAKTKKGQQFIQKKSYVENCYKMLALGSLNQLANPPLNQEIELPKQIKNPTQVQVRSVLWSLGFYGSTNAGIKKLKEIKVFDLIMELSRNSHTLSLRGTCRYILDMFCHSENGRALLMQNGLYVNNNCYTCYPKQTLSLYRISIESQKKNQEETEQYFWNFYKKSIKDHPMTKNQLKFFELLTMLISSFSGKVASNQLRQINRLSPKIANSINLFQNAITLQTYYKFKYENRKVIMNVFDEIIKSNLFNSVPNKNIEKQEKEQKIKKIKSSKNSIVFYMEEQIEQLFEIVSSSLEEQKKNKDLVLERIKSEQVQPTHKKL